MKLSAGRIEEGVVVGLIVTAIAGAAVWLYRQWRARPS